MAKKFRLRKEISKIVLKHKTFSPKRIRDVILHEYNVEMTPQNINVFFKRHPELVSTLKRQVTEDDGKFETIRFDAEYWYDAETKTSQIPIIQKWIDTMVFRKVREGGIRRRINYLKHVCEGTKAQEQIKDWKLHPMALTEEKAVEFLTELTKKGYDDQVWRMTIRNFLIFAKGEVPTKISGAITIGQMTEEYFEDEEVDSIYYTLDHDSEYADGVLKATVGFLHYSMTRIGATCRTKGRNFEKFRVKGHEIMKVTVYDKGKVGKKKRVKLVMPVLKKIIEDYGIKENMFPYTPDELRRELRKLYDKAQVKQPKQVGHVWRHTGAMYWLRKTGWNYTLVCAIGGWKEDKILRKCYGVPEMQDLIKMALSL